MDRRRFLKTTAVGLALRTQSAAAAAGTHARTTELRIARVLLQSARGRRLTPVAPNAYAPYRGYEATDQVLRIQTMQGLEGIGCYWGSPQALGSLLGLDPFTLFDWGGDTLRGAAEQHADRLDRLAGADVAILDLLGKAIGRPVADLLGRRVRENVPVYDSSLYMEDLLTPPQRDGLAYLSGPPPKDPAEMVAHKASWLMSQPGGIRIFKIKVGRARWMDSFDAALERDIAVVKAVRRAVGGGVALFVDGNNGYRPHPSAAADFALAVAGEGVLAMEEMFDEEMTVAAREVKTRLRTAGIATRLADGETHRGGIPRALLAERFVGPGRSEEPLYDVNQPDMNTTGYIGLLAAARTSAHYGVTWLRTISAPSSASTRKCTLAWSRPIGSSRKWTTAPSRLSGRTGSISRTAGRS